MFLSMSEWAGLQLSTAQKDIPSYHLGSSATEEPAGSAGSKAWIEITMTMTTIITTLSRIIPNTAYLLGAGQALL